MIPTKWCAYRSSTRNGTTRPPLALRKPRIRPSRHPTASRAAWPRKVSAYACGGTVHRRMVEKHTLVG